MTVERFTRTVILWSTILLVTATTVGAAPARALTGEDKQTLAVMAMQWVIDGGLADFKLIPDPNTLLVANVGLPKGFTLTLPGRKVTIQSPVKIQARADLGTDLLYFRLGPFAGTDERPSVSVALQWAVSVRRASQQPALGSGATLEFERRAGTWHLLPVTQRWTL